MPMQRDDRPALSPRQCVSQACRAPVVVHQYVRADRADRQVLLVPPLSKISLAGTATTTAIERPPDLLHRASPNQLHRFPTARWHIKKVKVLDELTGRQHSGESVQLWTLGSQVIVSRE